MLTGLGKEVLTVSVQDVLVLHAADAFFEDLQIWDVHLAKKRRAKIRAILASGLACKKCGIEAIEFACYESTKSQNERHLGVFWCIKGERFLTVDHIIPSSLGGGSIRKNLRTLCNVCNSERKNYIGDVWDDIPVGTKFRLAKAKRLELKSILDKSSNLSKEIQEKLVSKILDINDFMAGRVAWSGDHARRILQSY